MVLRGGSSIAHWAVIAMFKTAGVFDYFGMDEKVCMLHIQPVILQAGVRTSNPLTPFFPSSKDYLQLVESFEELLWWTCSPLPQLEPCLWHRSNCLLSILSESNSSIISICVSNLLSRYSSFVAFDKVILLLLMLSWCFQIIMWYLPILPTYTAFYLPVWSTLTTTVLLAVRQPESSPDLHWQVGDASCCSVPWAVSCDPQWRAIQVRLTWKLIVGLWL